MQEFCIVWECGAEARHYIRSSKRHGEVFPACTYHGSGVYLMVGKIYGGLVSISTSFVVSAGASQRTLTQGQGRHELAG